MSASILAVGGSRAGRRWTWVAIAAALSAVGGVALLAGATASGYRLVRATGAADEEGPGLVSRIAVVGSDLLVALDAAKQLRAPTVSTPEARVIAHRRSKAALKRAKAEAQREFQALCAASTAGVGAAAILEFRGTSARKLLAHGDLTSFRMEAPHKNQSGVLVSEGTRNGRATFLFSKKVTPPLGGPGRWQAYVWYDNVVVLRAGWSPTNGTILMGAIGAVLFMAGAVGSWWALRLRRHLSVESTAVAD